MSHAVIQDCRPFRNPGQLPEPPRPVKAFHPRKRQGIIRIVEWFHHAESPRSGKSQKLLIFPGRFPARNHCGIEPGTELGLRPARIISINVGQIGADPAGHHRRGQALLKRSQIYGYPSAKGIPDGAKSSKTVVGKGRQPVDRHAVKTHLNSIQRPVGKIPVKLFLQFSTLPPPDLPLPEAEKVKRTGCKTALCQFDSITAVRTGFRIQVCVQRAPWRGESRGNFSEVSAQPAPSGFEADSVVCSSTNRNNGRTAWDAKDEIIGRRNWDSGLTIQEYSELKELPYESTRRWIRVSQKTLKCIDSHIAFTSG